MTSMSDDPPAPQRERSGADRAYNETISRAADPSAPPLDDELEPLPSPARRAPQVDTGRLYRSAGAEGTTAAAAVPALSTETRTPRPAPRPAPSPAPSPSPTPRLPDPEDIAPSDESPVGTTYGDASAHPRRGGQRKGLTFLGVAVVIFGVTAILAVADVIGDRKLGLITGIGFVAACIYCALLVRTRDAIAMLIVPPLAWLLMLLTVGQFTIKGSGSVVVREGLMVFEGLAFNAPAVLIGTLSGVIIVVIRRVLASRR